MAVKKRKLIKYTERHIVDEITEYCVERIDETSERYAHYYVTNTARLIEFERKTKSDVWTISDIREASLIHIADLIEDSFGVQVELMDPNAPEPEVIKDTYSFFVGCSFGELGVYDIEAEDYETARTALLEKISVEVWTEIKYLAKITNTKA